ncbi:MAG: hypothetical protein NXI21_19335 [Alphaproteobacteria bacterium]|nr:hypothetical protein [Alphaproteobacteria bacterium]
MMKFAHGRRIAGAVAAIALLAGAAPASANEFEPQIRAFYDGAVKSWLSDPAVVDAVKAQNEAHAGFDDAKVEALDQQWRAEKDAGSGPLIDKVLANALSQYLKGKKEGAGGKITEVFVMDAKGLNVGQSDVTSDYMQGDEAKWQKTYGAGPDAVFVDEVEFDDSSESFQSQVSGTVVDPATGEAIGAITVGVAVENL